jgi:hypothetical protein
MRAPALVLSLAALALVSACAKRTKPPGDSGICYHVVQQPDGKLKYNKLVETDTLEKCAANLEAMRLRFLRMGGTQHELVGAFQSNYIFLERIGVRTGTSLEGPRYVALVRTGDGRLAVPGAMPQPTGQ